MPYQPRPTEAELELLNILWRRGTMTASELGKFQREPTPSIVRTRLLRQMLAKGFIERDYTEPLVKYLAIVDEDTVKNSLIQLLLEQLFDNSTRVLILHTLSHAYLSEEDLGEIRSALREMERRSQAPKPPKQVGQEPH
jgi:BlaI family transcriptional regulator, penicillinase repressor